MITVRELDPNLFTRPQLQYQAASQVRPDVFPFLALDPGDPDSFVADRLLARYDNQPPPAEVADDERITGNLLQSPYRFHKHGQSGLEFSETLPHTARHADRIRRQFGHNMQ